MVIMIGVDEPLADEQDDDLINDDQGIEDGLDFVPATGQSKAVSDENEVNSESLEIDHYQIPANDGKSDGKQVLNQVEAPEPTLKRSTRTKKELGRFEHYAIVAGEDPLAQGETVDSSYHTHWMQGITKELTYFKDRATRTKVVLPPEKTVIPYKKIFKQMLNGAGRVSRYKARLKARGISQKEDNDFFKTLVSVVTSNVLSMLAGKCVLDGWHVHHANSSTAFSMDDINHKLFAKCGLQVGETSSRVKKILGALI